MAISEEDFEAANQRMAERMERGPRALKARYDTEFGGALVIMLSTGEEVRVSIWNVPKLQSATLAQLEEIEVSPTGLGLHFPQLDADFELSGLLAGNYGM